MLNVYLGNFHPDLEDALCRHISQIKRDAPLSPLAIIVPSDHLRSRLKTLLTIERGMNLIGIHFLTFHSLAARLYEEKYGLVKSLIGDDFFYTEFLRYLLRTDAAEFAIFRHFSETPDGCAALWRTLRDLIEAEVDADNVIEAVKEGLFSVEDVEKLSPLILLYREFLLKKNNIGIIYYSDLVEIATGLVPSSKYLRQFKEIIYYGFYDLTQVQYDLFRTIVQHYPTTLYFPFVQGMPAFTFAKRFYEGYIQGVVTPPESPYPVGDRIEFCPQKGGFSPLTTTISTSGAEDEVLTVAKGILQLIERDGFSFSDIGVVARDIGEYGHLIKRIFDTHRIPFVSSASEPINRYQVTKAVHLFLTIPEGNYKRSDIIDLASSPFCKIRFFCPDGVEPRPDIWDMVTCSIGISKGPSGWERLDRYLKEGFILKEGEEDETEDHVISGAEIEGLKRFVSSLIDDFSSIPAVSTWSDYVERFRILIRKYVDIEGFIDDAFISLNDFSLISNEVTLQEFMDTFKRRLEGMNIPIGEDNIAGVQVFDAMAARGIPFKVLFVLGMNEKVFPRNIKEDPLLRDSMRGVLERVLGYKITEKLYGYEEEKLIFYLLLSSVKDRIYILYQRSDEAGQIKIPSWYLSEINRVHTLKEERIPRRMIDKFDSSGFFSYHLLTPRELSIRLILEGRDPTAAILKFNLNLLLYANGIKAIKILDSPRPGLSVLDGFTGSIEVFWERIRNHGTSPTSLEMYACCPFSYYANHLIGLRRLNRPETLFETHPAEIGDLCHKILKRFYMRGVGSDVDIENRLKDEASIVFTEFQQASPVGYPVLWEILQERLLAILKSVIENDLRELSLSGFKPYCFEVDVMGGMEGLKDMQEISVHGVLDRVDIQPESGLFRIIDYKFKSGAKVKSEDRNLSLSAIRGKRLQPPLYLLMAVPYLKYTCGIEKPVPEKVSFSFIAPNWSDDDGAGESRADFPGDCWQSDLGKKIEATISLLLRGIRDGLFFIIPGDYCKFCDYSSICRKNHFPSRWRAEKDTRVRPYYAVRQSR